MEIRVRKKIFQWDVLWSKSGRIQVTNLVHNISEEQLTEHIAQTCKDCRVIPTEIDIRRHWRRDYPAIAVLNMPVVSTAEDAQNVVNKLRMSTYKGRKMWAKQIKDFERPRHARTPYTKGRYEKITVDDGRGAKKLNKGGKKKKLKGRKKARETMKKKARLAKQRKN